MLCYFQLSLRTARFQRPETMEFEVVILLDFEIGTLPKVEFALDHFYVGKFLKNFTFLEQGRKDAKKHVRSVEGKLDDFNITFSQDFFGEKFLPKYC